MDPTSVASEGAHPQKSSWLSTVFALQKFLGKIHLASAGCHDQTNSNDLENTQLARQSPPMTCLSPVHILGGTPKWKAMEHP